MFGLSRRGNRERAAARRNNARRRALKPWMDGLEDRVVLSNIVPTITWTGDATGGNWNDAANWTDDVNFHRVPAAGDAVSISLASGAVTYNAGTLSITSLSTSATTTLIVSGGTLKVSDAFVNSGGLEITGSGSIFEATSAYTQLGGFTTLADAGKLSSPGGTVTVNGGWVGGIGTISGSLVNNSEVIPGWNGTNNAGTLTVNGNYTQSGSAKLTTYISSELGFGRLKVRDTAHLAGDLVVPVLNGYNPVDHSFNVLGFDGRDGSFDHILPQNLAPGVSAYAFYFDSGSGDNLSVGFELPTSITVDPSPQTIAKGQTASFSANAHYANAPDANLTSLVTWGSVDTDVATITSPGYAYGVQQGDTTITATLGLISGSAALHVNPAALVSFTISPTNTAVQKGANRSFTAWGTYTDGGQHDATDEVAWSSSDEAIATIASDGVATGLAIGSTTITASYSGIPSAHATLKVQAAVTETGVSWGSRTAALVDNGAVLLPLGRTNTISWYGIKEIQISLGDPAATLAKADISINGQVLGPMGFSLAGSNGNYTITLANSIEVADRVTITLGNDQVETFSRRLDVLPGDVNDDGVVTMQDAIYVRNGYLGIQPLLELIFLDVLGEEKASLEGANIVRSFIGKRLPS